MTLDIHKNQPVIELGPSLENAKLVVILLHGRGATAESVVGISEALDLDNVSFWIPQAALNRWYPQSAFGPIEANEPDLSSALAKIDSLVKTLKGKGFSEQQIAFGGFSQGACLASEFVARSNKKFAALFVYSGALIGPKGTPRTIEGSLEGMPVFIGGSDVDPWVSHDLIDDTAQFFIKMGANVDFRTYPGMAHTINQDEIIAVKELLTHAIKMPV